MLEKIDSSTQKEMYDAIYFSKLDKIKSLNFSGELFNQPCEPGTTKTFIHLAAAYSQPEVVEYLIALGADVNKSCKYEVGTPLSQALNHNGLKVFNILLNYGADPNSKNSLGQTLLHESIDYCSYDQVKALLEAGANIKIIDRNGRTPYQFALKKIKEDKKYRAQDFMQNGYTNIANLINQYDITNLHEKIHQLEEKNQLMENQISLLAQQVKEMQHILSTQLNPSTEQLPVRNKNGRLF